MQNTLTSVNIDLFSPMKKSQVDNCVVYAMRIAKCYASCLDDKKLLTNRQKYANI